MSSAREGAAPERCSRTVKDQQKAALRLGRIGADESRRLVEAGRVCLVNFGPLVGKLVVVVNVVDGKRVLVDGPSSVNGVARQIMPLARLSLTVIKIDIEPGARLPTLMKAYKAADVQKQWSESSWAKGIAKKAAKTKLSDFDRFKVMVARKTRARVVNTHMKKMLKK